MTIAQRKLLYRGPTASAAVPVVVAIRSVGAGKLEGLVECVVETTCGTQRLHEVYGDDSLQAISLGLLTIVNFLRDLDSTGHLALETGEPYDFKADYMYIMPLDEIATKVDPFA